MNQPASTEKDPKKPSHTGKPAKRKWLWRLLMLFGLLLCVLAGTLMFLVSTDKGTAYFLNIVSNYSKVKLEHGKGNLMSGLDLHNIIVPLDKQKNNLHIDTATVKIGWRSLINQEVLHLREVKVNHVHIIDDNLPTGKPFSYAPIKLPIGLQLDNVQVARFTHQKITRNPVVITDIAVTKLGWVDDLLSLNNGKLTYKNYANVQALNGTMQFTGTYPINATAKVVVPIITKHQFSEFALKVGGSLKNVTGTAAGTWHGMPLTADISTQPLVARSPYQGVVHLQQLKLPYVRSENVNIHTGALAFNGNMDKLALALNANLKSKHLPTGDYHAVALMPLNKEAHTAWAKQTHQSIKDIQPLQFLDVTKLTAKTKLGGFSGKGLLAWHDGIALNMVGKADKFNVAGYVPKTAHAYAPTVLDGSFDVNYAKKAKASTAKLVAFVQQRAGDSLQVTMQLPENLQKQSMAFHAKVHNQSLKNVPLGDYKADIRWGNAAGSQAKKLWLHNFVYQGEAGDLTGDATLLLPQNTAQKKPITWQAQLHTPAFNLQKIPQTANLPVALVKGNLHATGSMLNNKQALAFKRIDLSTDIRQTDSKQGEYRRIALAGTGDVSLNFQPAAKSSQLTFMDVRYQGQVTTAGIPKGDTDVHISGVPENLHIHRLVHSGDAGKLNVQGKLDRRQGMVWQLQGKAQQFNPKLFVPAFAGNLTGEFDTAGIWQKNKKLVHIKNMNVTGTLKNKPLLAKGALMLNLNMQQDIKTAADAQNAIETMQADALRVQWQDNFLVADGNQQKLTVQVNAKTLHQLHPKLTGKAVGTVVLDGVKQSKPSMLVDLTLANIAMKSVSVGSGTLKGHLLGFATSPSKLAANLQQVRFGSGENKVFSTVNVLADGTQQQHDIHFDIKHASATVSGQLQGGFQGSGVKALSHWQGKLMAGKVKAQKMQLFQQQPAQVNINTTKDHFQVSKHCWFPKHSRSTKLCLNENLLVSSQKGAVDIEVSGISSQLFGGMMPEGVVWQGAINGKSKLRWQQGTQPKINAAFYTDNGSIGITADEPQDDDITLDYNRLSLVLASQPKGIKLRFDAKTRSAGNGYIDAVIDPKSAQKTINGAMVLDNIRLDVLTPFFPGVRQLKGTASLAGGMSGPLKGPQFYGNFKLKNAALSMLALPVNLHNISLTSAIRGTHASINGEFGSGTGKGTLTGKVDWKEQLAIDLLLKGNKLAIRKPPSLYVAASPNISIKVAPAKKRISILGKVNVDNATIRPLVEESNVIRESADVVIIDKRRQKAGHSTQTLTAEQKQAMTKVFKAAKRWQVNADVALDLQKNTYFRGFGANVPLNGVLKIKQSGQQVTQGYGIIAVSKRVPVQVYGQSLDLTQGELRFSGNINAPRLNIVTEKKVSGSTVGVAVEGSPTRPVIEVFNDAGLTEQQAINALITGRINSSVVSRTSVSGFQSDVNNALTAAGLSLGLQRTRTLTNQIGRDFGLSGLTVDATGTDDDAKVNITGYITPDLYLRYGVGVFTSTNQLTLRYQLSRRFYIEASSALEKAIDVFYNWRF